MGRLERNSENKHKKTAYEAVGKRIFDIVLSYSGLVVLAPVYLLLALAIVIDDPGPVLFTQKRVGQDKALFRLHKFRTMKKNTPHNTPTHLLKNPEQYITRVGKFLRKFSLDELPQLWDILVGDMSIVGPRPALWNQNDLVAERDKYGANSVKPGLTGWAQINGRDELEIAEKARYDGAYVRQLKKNSISGMFMDARCFIGTIMAVMSHDGVVEGGTGELHRSHEQQNGASDIYDRAEAIDYSAKRRVLITGANSYIGTSFEYWAKTNYGQNFEIDTVDMQDDAWRQKDFSDYDAVFHVAGIAHADVGNVSEEVKKSYYAVNTDLAIETAKWAKVCGVKQFVFMSSMIVYGDSAGYGTKKVITRHTVPHPANFYGDSKWQADMGVRDLQTETFQVAVLRPPMVYGRGSKGNYPVLEKMAKKLPIFPKVENERSMLYIDNLCEFLCQLMLLGRGGVFFPQNPEYLNTSNMVGMIARESGHNIFISKVFAPMVWVASKLPNVSVLGKVKGLANKAFGNMSYEHSMSTYKTFDYQKVGLAESVRRMVNGGTVSGEEKPRALMLASVASMIDQFNMPNIKLLQDMGYDVEVACNFIVGNTCSRDRIEELKERLSDQGVKYYQIDFSRNAMDLRQDFVSYKQIKKLLKERRYSFVHCHSPIGGAVGRIACNRTKTKVIYTAHGFHFFKGASLKKWLIFYPIEWLLSWVTDELITINQEDCRRAKKHLHAKKTVYVPGVGVDLKKFASDQIDIAKKRTELNVSEDNIMLLSVGELSARKNHEVVIRAIGQLHQPKIKYFICGMGALEPYLKNLILELELENQVNLLGYRTDISELCQACDLFVFPSKQEGLPVALMEAMSAGLPVVCSRIRGNVDLIKDGKGGYLCDPKDVDSFAEQIGRLLIDEEFRDLCGAENRLVIKKFDLAVVAQKMTNIYKEIGQDR